jgi:ankyrin repeat protein
MASGETLVLAHRAFCNDDVATLRALLEEHPELRSRINDAQNEFGSPPIVNAKSRAMIDFLLELGADINTRSKWWAGGFGVLHNAPAELARYAIECGAQVDIHAAARLGLFDHVRELLAADPKLVHARGGDGQTPLHFASTEQIASYLLDHGADINARDIDHESTPAQWMLGDRIELARYLVQRGCKTDLLMAAALGDIELTKKHLDVDPNSIRMRVSEEYFPMVGGKAGGTVYQWTLGWHVSPHQVAKVRGYQELFNLLMERSPAEVKLINYAWLHDELAVEGILSQNREIAQVLTAAELRQLAHAARNNDAPAVRLLLRAGLPINSRGQHNATPLHWSAWHGNVDAVRLLLEHDPDLEDADNEFSSSPLGWAIHGSENGWHRESGNYAATIELLLRAGVKIPDKHGGTPEVKEVLKRFDSER